MPNKEIPFAPSTLETIDEAIFKYINEEMDLRATTNKGWKKTPIIWASAERAYQIKNDKDLRDGSGTLILPLITIERNLVIKDMNRKGVFWGNVDRNSRGGSIIYTRKINQNKTSNFANADSHRKKKQLNFPRENKKVVYQWISMPMPVYVEVVYAITLRTEYQQQMNELMTPFATKTGAINYFAMRTNNHFYEGFIQGDFQSMNNLVSLGEDERKYETKINIKVLGYLVGEGKNQETPKVVIHENTVEVKLPRERIVMGDIQEHLDDQEDNPERLENEPEMILGSAGINK
tara:strand:+ start:998 stop:1870 length:873 start_codon:yes stop_codon:yes gene_type:complete